MECRNIEFYGIDKLSKFMYVKRIKNTTKINQIITNYLKIQRKSLPKVLYFFLISLFLR
jgi:hypothetical protein